jgi:hypothetical protein
MSATQVKLPSSNNDWPILLFHFSTIGLIFAMDALIFVSLSLAEAKVTIELLAIIQFR